MRKIGSFIWGMIIFLLSPISFLYQIIFKLNQSRKDPKPLHNCLVISVGNLSVGGTGKTPFVQYLVHLLKTRYPKYHISILSRGYGAKASSEGKLVAVDDDPMVVGDEPLLHKQRFPWVQVLIGKHRYRVFQNLNKHLDPHHFVLLDDGFQHKAIVRNLDIVLLDSNAPLSNGYTIPLGKLREPVSSLQRADTLVFTKLNSINERLVNLLIPKLKAQFPSLPILYASSLYSYKRVLGDQDEFTTGVLICGVGNPESVFYGAKSLFPTSHIQTIYFPDHAHYEYEDLKKISENHSSYIPYLCTTKDWVKWSKKSAWMQHLKETNRTVFVLDYKVVLRDESTLVMQIDDLVSRHESKISLEETP